MLLPLDSQQAPENSVGLSPSPSGLPALPRCAERWDKHPVWDHCVVQCGQVRTGLGGRRCSLVRRLAGVLEDVHSRGLESERASEREQIPVVHSAEGRQTRLQTPVLGSCVCPTVQKVCQVLLTFPEIETSLPGSKKGEERKKEKEREEGRQRGGEQRERGEREKGDREREKEK